MNFLREEQYNAVARMKNGCILNGDVGSGKSRTALYYYYTRNGGVDRDGQKHPMNKKPKDLLIITTARKRDIKEWESEMAPFALSPDPKLKYYDHQVWIDSWNNIKKYHDVKDAFIIFDEDRVVGYGAWSKEFIHLAKQNEWIMLSATPGDTWSDYISVFIANGFYKNKTEFEREHVVWSRHSTFPKIERYFNEGRLIRLRNNILVDMTVNRVTTQHHEYVTTDYDKYLYSRVYKDRWNIFEDKPIENASEMCTALRKICSIHESRQEAVLELLEQYPTAILFYNYDFELEILRTLDYAPGTKIAEWNGHRHDEIPQGKRWVYLVQYTAGCEGWNCITTNVIIFYSENYSYRVMHQAAGRIDRLNTQFLDLYYYHLRTRSSIDLSVAAALKRKKKFNEGRFYYGSSS